MFDATHLQNVQPTAMVNVAEKVQFPKMARRVIPSEVEESRRKTYNDSTGSFDSAALRRDDTSFRQAGLLA